MPEIPLFPLKTVLLPGNKLPLKIFEPRYTDMIAQCLREDTLFGVVFIYKGEEVADKAEIYSIGTTAVVSDWQQRNDGLLGITALGKHRFTIHKTRQQTDGLVIADVEVLEEKQQQTIPEHYQYMLELLRHVKHDKSQVVISEEDFNQTIFQLIFLLPLDNILKQRLLEIPSCLDRAAILHAELIRLGVIQYIEPTLSS